MDAKVRKEFAKKNDQFAPFTVSFLTPFLRTGQGSNQAPFLIESLDNISFPKQP